MDLFATEDATDVGDVPTGAVAGVEYEEPVARPLTKGEALGRYVVLRQLGAGAMGTVYLAYDPELDRKVALKILRGASGEASRRALLREAQAMAKLRHPNVVAVHDVGEHQGRIYVAMDFIEGVTLGKWMRAEPRGWREVLDMFLRAGQGLASAHAHELIHRDFKPDNVMVSIEGEVLVMDFGLARPSGDAREHEHEPEIESLSGSVLTEATVGHLAGTPAYMAPEQVRAEELSPAADQFAFCVSVWQGVCGERPFAGRSIAELYTNTSGGSVRSPPATARMPRWLERVLLRGLAARVEDRWPSMDALMAALDRGRRRWRWQAVLAGVGVVALVVGALVGVQIEQEREQRGRVEACEAEAAAIDEVWNAEAREELRAGLLATNLDFAQGSVDTLMPWLDDYRDAWHEGRNQACIHATITGDWDEELLDRATWCLEDRRLQFEATVNQISTLDRKAARRAERLASYLDPVETCLDPTLLDRLPVPPIELRDAIREIRGLLTDADRMRHGGRYGEALELGQRARVRAEVLAWPPLVANARFIEGRCLTLSGEFEAATTALTRAYFEALEAGSIEVAFRAARSLISALTSHQRYREAELWARHAEVLAPQLADPSGLDAAEGHYLLLSVYQGLGDYEAAIAEGEQAVAMRSAALGSDHPITAAAIRNLGMAYLAQGRADRALEHFDRALRIWENAVGHDHPYIGDLTKLRGGALAKLGRLDEALVQLDESIEIYEQLLGSTHPKLAQSFARQAMVYAELGRLDEADVTLARGLEITRDKLGPRRPATARMLLDLCTLDQLQGRHELALEHCREANEILSQTLEPGHPDIARAEAELAKAQAAPSEPATN